TDGKQTGDARRASRKGSISPPFRHSHESGTAFAEPVPDLIRELQTRTTQAARSASAMDGASNPVSFLRNTGRQRHWIPDIASRFRDDEQKLGPSREHQASHFGRIIPRAP